MDGAAQVKYVLTHPLQYIIALYRSGRDGAEWNVKTGAGALLSWHNVQINETLIWIYLFVVLTVALVHCKSDIQIRMKDKWIMGILAAGIILLIYTSLYVQWTPVGQNQVMGIQGRYFLPIAGTALLLLSNENVQVQTKQNKGFMFYSFIGFLSVFTVLSYLTQML